MRRSLALGLTVLVSAATIAACTTHKEETIVREQRTIIQPAPTASTNTTTIERRDTMVPGSSTATIERTTSEPSGSTTTVRRTTTAGDPHEAWWRTYRNTEPYDYNRAEASHRMFCDNSPADSSCAGWYVRQ